MDEKIRKSGSNTKCKNCGTDLFFDPATQALKCSSCSSIFEFEKSSDVAKHQWETRNEQGNYNEWVEESKFVKCQSCGAEIVLARLDITHNCPYCGSTYVLEVDSLPGYRPDGVIPFMFNEEDASSRFLVGVKKRFFVPRSFKIKTPTTSIHGIYVPAFTFDGKSSTKYYGVLVKEKHKKNSKGESYVEREHFNISGNEDMIHTNYIEESSSHITDKQLSQLLPYDISGCLSFDKNFLRGYSVEHYDSAIEVAYQNSHNKMEANIKRQILSKYDYTYVESFNMSSNYYDEFFAYRLIPLYIFEFMYKKKRYTVLMNGQSGKIGKGLPISPIKVTLLVLLILVIAICIFILFLFSE